MIEIEIENRSGAPASSSQIESVCRTVLAAEGVETGELGIWLVDGGEMRGLKRDHLGIDDVGDVLSFPIDGSDPVPDGVPRALGDIFLCPAVVGDDWRPSLIHGLLHLLGYTHGPAMERREAELAV